MRLRLAGVELTDQESEFIRQNTSAAMTTIGPDGLPRSVRVSVGLVEGELLSSGTADRVRTRRLRQDPRCSLFVFGGEWQWLTLETRVTILDGEESLRLNVDLIREIEGRPTGPISWLGGRELTEDEFLAEMVREHRLIYRFDVIRTYGEF